MTVFFLYWQLYKGNDIIITIQTQTLLLVVVLVDIVFCVIQSNSFPVLYKYPLGVLNTIA